MKEFLKQIFKKTLNIDDLRYLSKLLNNNIPLHECFELLSNSSNAQIFNQIIKQLDKGELIENVISDYVTDEIRSYLKPLLKYMSFSSALSLSLDFHEKNKEGIDSLISSIAYPCILLFITVTALYLFDIYGMDSMFSLMGSFSSDIALYQDIRILFRIVINIIYYGFLIVVLLFIYLKQPKRIVIMYIFISRYFVNSLFNLYYCEQFMSLMLICFKQGFKTRESMQILKSMKNKPIVSFLAFHIDDGLMNGETLKEAAQKKYYDSSLARYIKMAGYTNDFAGVINSYLTVTADKIKNKIKLYALTIQLATYSFIGAVIIFIYQLLFMPMQAITLF